MLHVLSRGLVLSGMLCLPLTNCGSTNDPPAATPPDEKAAIALLAEACQAMIVDNHRWEANDKAEHLARQAAAQNPAADGFADMIAQLNTEAHHPTDQIHYHQLRNALTNACTTVEAPLP
ncbi:hypothetical protein [Kribbella sp. NPDC004536]|uniref:hypothetical protein n=1 Tax=Kribbella sp. NPDC004536 TaxID=3364106 RepID=UPI00368CD047